MINSNAEIIRPDSDDKLVSSVKVFERDGGLFYDEAFTKSVSKDEATDLVSKGLMLVSSETGLFRATGITFGEGDAYTVIYGLGTT